MAHNTKQTIVQNSDNFGQGRLRAAPDGFSEEQWKVFIRDGILVVPNALSPVEINRYLEAAKDCLRRFPEYSPLNTWKVHDLIRKHEAFRELIDNDRHIGYAYDIYGDQTRLVQADLFVRPKNSVINHWHVDGPRAVPYSAFSPTLPLKLRIGYWLTDLPHGDMGNIVYLPGSHLPANSREYTGIADIPGQETLKCRAGTMTIAHSNIWHRVTGNCSEQTRINLFLSYTPSWITGYYEYPHRWLATLTREQRIILRGYKEKEDLTRPPAEDLPLFFDPTISNPNSNSEEFHKRRRLTRYERHLKPLQP